jgi:hypothetical protein
MAQGKLFLAAMGWIEGTCAQINLYWMLLILPPGQGWP